MMRTKTIGANKWILFIIFIPFSAVLFGILMFVAAHIYKDDLVVDDYYKEGLSINTILTRENLSKEMDIYLELMNITKRRAEFKLDNIQDHKVLLSFHHVSDKQKDKEFILLHEGGYKYTSHNPQLISILQNDGVWNIELTGSNREWSLKKRIVTPSRDLVIKP